MRRFRELNCSLWGRHLWSRGYFVATSGNVTDDELQNDDFKGHGIDGVYRPASLRRLPKATAFRRWWLSATRFRPRAT
ncbi:MAG TPA: transposase [Polyangia bacterium]|nr:transposase [Polyangia bacterium]